MNCPWCYAPDAINVSMRMMVNTDVSGVIIVGQGFEPIAQCSACGRTGGARQETAGDGDEPGHTYFCFLSDHTDCPPSVAST